MVLSVWCKKGGLEHHLRHLATNMLSPEALILCINGSRGRIWIVEAEVVRAPSCNWNFSQMHSDIPLTTDSSLVPAELANAWSCLWLFPALHHLWAEVISYFGSQIILRSVLGRGDQLWLNSVTGQSPVPSAPVHPEVMLREGSEPCLIIANLTDQF